MRRFLSVLALSLLMLLAPGFPGAPSDFALAATDGNGGDSSALPAPNTVESLGSLPARIEDPSETDEFRRGRVSEQFDRLRIYRNKLIFRLQALNSQLQVLEPQMKDLVTTFHRIESEIPPPVQDNSNTNRRLG